MEQRYLFLLMLLAGALLISACDDPQALATSSFGGRKNAKASPASVISMGRDDDDGLAKKWSIGSSGH